MNSPDEPVPGKDEALGALAQHFSLLSTAPSFHLPSPSLSPSPSYRLRKHFPANNLLVPILRVSFQKGKAWENEWQTTAEPASSFSFNEATETLPHNPYLPEEVGSQPAPDPSLPCCPRLKRGSGSSAQGRPFLFILRDELLLSLSAVLALLFVFKSSYNFAPGFIANCIYLLLPRVSAQIF